MTISLGLDIGSNSVGSAWVDTEGHTLTPGVSVFPAGVDETDTKRGAPVNQKRREKRSQRRNLARRAQRRRLLRGVLTRAGLLPQDGGQLTTLFGLNPWHLRRDALSRALSAHEFGRALVHLNQRRGAFGVETDPKDDKEGKVKEAIDRLKAQLNGRTFGQFMADLMDKRRRPVVGKPDKHYQDPIRNRRDKFEFHADRPLIRAEFNAIWDKQKSFDSPLARLLTDDLKRELDDAREDDTWRHRGVLFGQRRTYWDTGTLGRCDLEPTDQCCPMADMYAQEFRVVETVNNIRIEEQGQPARALTAEERARVIDALRKQKSGSVATVRKALGIDKKAVKAFFALNIERDPDREINTDWFYREIVHGVFTEDRWLKMDTRLRDSVNRALLRFDPDTAAHGAALRDGARRWWGLEPDAADRIVAAWSKRPKLEVRVSLSRRAIQNLLPYMNEFDTVNKRWPTQIEARQRFVEDGSHDAPPEQRRRYALDAPTLTKADRHYLRKHPDLLPPAPLLANPVVRKAIHEVRRHVMAYLRRFGCRPDRIVIEFAREAKQSGKVRQAALDRNRWRDKARKEIIAQFDLGALSLNQQRAAVERALLCRQQRYVCAYTGETISEDRAVQGADVETDHIVPYSRCGDNSLNNKVLCCRASNRGKGNKTPREWLGERFGELLQRFAHFERYRPQKGALDSYFSPKDYARKWENLTREVREGDEWKNSQLTDTAYAARQVAAYLRDALYAGDQSGQRRVYVTNGKYTALLRRDWQLFQSLKPRSDTAGSRTAAASQEPAPAEKERADHRHHAIDAVAIALTDPRIEPILARQAADAEVYHERTGHWPQRTPLPPPWGAVEEFRSQVLTAVDQLVVSHRPVKRRVVGAFHEETAYGPVVAPLPAHRREAPDTLFTNRIRVESLTPKHLRVPEGWDELSVQLDDGRTSDPERRAIRRQLAALQDPPPGKSGIVRDRALRDRLRKCLRAGGSDPDVFSKDQIRKLAESGKLCMPGGVPVKCVVLLRTNTDPVVIPRKSWDPVGRRYVPDADPRTRRVYIGGNNHHIEIREDLKTGRWSGEVVPTFEAARRLRIEKRPAVDRFDRDGERFVMSLSEGETVCMRHPDTGEPGYFVVFKLDKPRTVHFIHHSDARPSQVRKDEAGKEIPHSKREDIAVTPADLKTLGVEADQPPYKVRISPLGELKRLEQD